eukprot:6189724-Pleurochrysis_carterae.AAC.2
MEAFRKSSVRTAEACQTRLALPRMLPEERTSCSTSESVCCRMGARIAALSPLLIPSKCAP